MAISPARKAAFDILLRVESGSGHSSSLLDEIAAGLDASDRALCHEITLGTLRNVIYLDRLISLHSSKRPSALDPEVRTALRMALYQAKFLDRVPDFAIVNDAVSLTVRARKRSARGFVNAVLRKFLRESAEPEFGSPDEELIVRHSHPEWLYRRWESEFGNDEAIRLLEANNRPRPLAVRLTRKFDLADDHVRERALAVLSATSTTSGLVPDSFVLDRHGPDIRELVDEGLAYFQDEGSQIVARALGDVRGRQVLDLCAAPGSKTSLIARSASPDEGLIVASDDSPKRISVLSENLVRQAAGFVRLVRLDASERLPFPDMCFDRILVDAPCTGTGTISANPEIRYRVRPEDISKLARKQRNMLGNASKALKKGGRLVYSTCSLEREENEEVIGAFLAENPDFHTTDTGTGVGETGAGGTVRLLPHRHGTEGFFIAALERR